MQGLSVEIGTEQGLGAEGATGIAGEPMSTQRIGTGGKSVEYQTAVWERTSTGRSSSPYQWGGP